MKYVQFCYKDRPNDLRVGYLDGDCVVDISVRDKYCVPKTMLQCLQQDEEFWKDIKALKDRVPYCNVPFKDINLKAPITGMDKVICMGHNYKDFCEMHNIKVPRIPFVYNKFPSSIIGPQDSVKIRTEVSNHVDWGVHLCLVIGKKASCVRAKNAHRYVFGCTIAQDITDRDWMKNQNGGQYLLGKSMDTFCPIGPWIVTLDEVGNPEKLDISCKMNGVYKQRSNTSEIIHRIPDVFERLTSIITLLPGDIILTGTPAGIGFFANPPEYLKKNDVLVSEIQNIGVLETRIDNYVKPPDEYHLPMTVRLL